MGEALTIALWAKIAKFFYRLFNNIGNLSVHIEEKFAPC